MSAFAESNQSLTNDSQKAFFRKPRGGVDKANGFYTKLKFTCFMKKRMTSVVAKNPTVLHEEGELVQRPFPKPTITLNALVAVYITAVIQ